MKSEYTTFKTKQCLRILGNKEIVLEYGSPNKSKETNFFYHIVGIAFTGR